MGVQTGSRIRTDCPGCGRSSSVPVSSMPISEEAGAKVDKIEKIEENKMASITKQDISTYLSARLHDGDLEVSPQDLADWNTQGKLRKSVFDKLHREIGLQPPSQPQKQETGEPLLKTEDIAKSLEVAARANTRKSVFEKSSKKAQDFVSSEIKHLKEDKGYPQKRAVAAALNIARDKGYKISKSDGVPVWFTPEGKMIEDNRATMTVTPSTEAGWIHVRGDDISGHGKFLDDSTHPATAAARAYVAGSGRHPMTNVNLIDVGAGYKVKPVQIGNWLRKEEGETKDEALNKAPLTLSKEDITHILLDLIRERKYPQQIGSRTLTKFQLTGELDDDVKKLVHKTVGIFEGQEGESLEKSHKIGDPVIHQKTGAVIGATVSVKKTETEGSILQKAVPPIYKREAPIGPTFFFGRRSSLETNGSFMKSILINQQKPRGAYQFKDMDDLKAHVHGSNFSIISGADDNNPHLHAENHSKLINLLKARGIPHTEVVGHFTKKDSKTGEVTHHHEPSVILHGVGENEANQIAHQFGQWGHIHVGGPRGETEARNKLVYNDPNPDGSRSIREKRSTRGSIITDTVHPETGNREAGKLYANDGWTEVPLANGKKAYLALNLDWD